MSGSNVVTPPCVDGRGDPGPGGSDRPYARILRWRTAFRFAAVAVVVIAIDWSMRLAMGASHSGRLIGSLALLDWVLPFVIPTFLAARWHYSGWAIMGMLYGLIAIDVAFFGVRDYGWDWLSPLNVGMWTALIGTPTIWLFLLPPVLILRTKRSLDAAKAQRARANP